MLQVSLFCIRSLVAYGTAMVACFAFASDYYVSPVGDDSSAGTAEAPWRTIQHAASTVEAGSTVLIRGGIYREQISIEVSGNEAAGPIVFKAHPGEEVILDGENGPRGKGWQPMIAIQDDSYIRIEGLEMRNFYSSTRNVVPIAIHITGASHHIDIVDNVLHDMGTRYEGKNGGDAHGIAVYGEGTVPIHDILIAGNELFDLQLGSSEALVLNGNVSDFEVRDNVVRDCNNLGIVFIGFEGVGKGANDRARRGVCRDNLVYGIDSSHNPAYGGDFERGGGERSAGGIYVDGGSEILIERNVIYQCNIGIELASEHQGGSADRITLCNNLIYHNDIGGVFIGGYDKKRGYATQCTITGNTLFENDQMQDGNGEICLQFDVKNCRIQNNLIHANAQGLFISNVYTENADNIVNHQFFSSPGEAVEWQWKKQNYTSLASYQTASGNDVDSTLGKNPFVNAAQYDFRLAADSPARDAGDEGYVPASGESDLLGSARKIGSAIDPGAFERADDGASAQLSISSEKLEFAATSSGDESLVRGEFSLTNSGTLPFRPTRIVIEGPNADSFRLLRSFAILPPGETIPVRIAFTPRQQGELGASLVLYGVHTGEKKEVKNEIRIALIGKGGTPDTQKDKAEGSSKP